MVSNSTALKVRGLSIALTIVVSCMALGSCASLGPVRAGSPWLESRITKGESSHVVRNWLTDYGPFSPRTYVEYVVADSSKVQLVLKDSSGLVWDVLVDEWQRPGRYGASFHTCSISARSFVWKLHLEFSAGDVKEVHKTFLTVRKSWFDPCPAPYQSVSGTIFGTFGNAMPLNPWPDSTPLAGANVQLREFNGIEARAGRVVASTLVDSLGNFGLIAPRGKYFLVVRSANGYCIWTGGHGNFVETENVSYFEIIELGEKDLTKNIHAVVCVTS